MESRSDAEALRGSKLHSYSDHVTLASHHYSQQSRSPSLSPPGFTAIQSFFHKLAFLGGKMWKIRRRPVSMHRITGLCKSSSLFQSTLPFQPVMLSTRVDRRSLHRVLDSVKGPPGFIVGLPRVPHSILGFPIRPMPLPSRH